MALSLTTADNLHTYSVRVGQSVEITLSQAEISWGPVQIQPSGLLQLGSGPAPPPHGQLVILAAMRPGTASVSAGGTAACSPGTICPMFVILFKVTLVIS